MHDAWMHAHARMGAHTYTYTWGHVSDLVLHMYTYTNYSPPFPCLAEHPAAFAVCDEMPAPPPAASCSVQEQQRLL